MVGTRPIFLPRRRGSASASRSSALERTILMRAPHGRIPRPWPPRASPARRRGGRARAQFSARATRWPCTVARSPRAIGPVRAAAPRSAQLAAVRRTIGASSSRASSTPIRASTSAADSSRATSRLEAMAAAAWYAARFSSGTSNGSHPEPLCESAGIGERLLRGAGDRGRHALNGRLPVRERLQRVERERRRTALGRRGEGIECGRPADVADPGGSDAGRAAERWR